MLPLMRPGCAFAGWRRRVMMALAISSAVALAAPCARAACISPPPGLLWSYPANGAIDVPLDADLFVNGELYSQPELGGEPLLRIANGVYDLGLLEAQTRYEVRWDGAVIGFTTGDTIAPAPREPSPDVLLTRNPMDSTRCPLVLPQGCFDTGEPTRVRFDAGLAMGWLLDVWSCGGTARQVLWPSACGAPVVESEDRIVCVSARSTGGAGLSASTGVICSVPDVPLATLPRSSECQGMWPPESALTLASGDAVTLGSISGLQSATDEPSSGEAVAPPEAVSCELGKATGNPWSGVSSGALAGVGLAALMRRRKGAAALKPCAAD